MTAFKRSSGIDREQQLTEAQSRVFDNYLRESADNNLSDRVAEQRGPNKKAPKSALEQYNESAR